MEAYIMVEQKERLSQKKFVATLAKAAVLKDNPKALTSECGRIYQWLWRYQHEMGGRKSSKADKVVKGRQSLPCVEVCTKRN
jgi:hypothetical protein